MPGIHYSLFDPATPDAEACWRFGVESVKHRADYTVDAYSEPGFRLACIYPPGVCRGPRLLVTQDHVLAVYGNLFDEYLCSLDGETLCRKLLALFCEHGCVGLHHLNGRYDVVVWERRTRVLHHISDRFGANRHYFHRRHSELHVACEVKALAPWLEQVEIDPAGLASMLAIGYHLGELTALRDVHGLPNACQLRFQSQTSASAPDVDADEPFSLTRYWDFPYGDTPALDASEDALAATLHDKLARALKRQLTGVSKILLPLSGGLDSRTLAGLLQRSDFRGEVLAYSYGKASSRDCRYGRALARTLGYRHVSIPTPVDFMTRQLEEAAWVFDAEWPADSNWGARFSHRHPVLGDTRSCVVLNGLFGDMLLGVDRYNYRHKAGDAPIDARTLARIFSACVRDMPIDGLFSEADAAEADARLERILADTFASTAARIPFYALMRAEFIHRQRRHTATMPQSVEYDLPMITPFLDPEVVDFSMQIPYGAFYARHLYKHMLKTCLPRVAAIPYAGTGLPLLDSPLREAAQWRLERFLSTRPKVQGFFSRRNQFFDFRAGIRAQAGYFRERAHMLDLLVPPLDAVATRARVDALLAGRLPAAEQITSLFPLAVFLRELKQKLQALKTARTHARSSCRE